MFPPCPRGEKNPTPDEKSGVRYEQTYSTVPPCLRSQRSAARVLCNGRSRPSLHIGGRLQGGGWGPVIGKSRLQPMAAPLCCLSRSASFSMPFFKFEDTIPRRCVPVKGTFCLFWRLFEGQLWWFFAGAGRVLPVQGSPLRGYAPHSLLSCQKRMRRARWKRKSLRRRGGPCGPSLRATRVVRIGPARIDSPVDPAPYPGGRGTAFPHNDCGDCSGCKIGFAPASLSAPSALPARGTPHP